MDGIKRGKRGYRVSLCVFEISCCFLRLFLDSLGFEFDFDPSASFRLRFPTRLVRSFTFCRPLFASGGVLGIDIARFPLEVSGFVLALHFLGLEPAVLVSWGL